MVQKLTQDKLDGTYYLYDARQVTRCVRPIHDIDDADMHIRQQACDLWMQCDTSLI